MHSQVPIIKRLACSAGGKWFWENHCEEFEDSFGRLVDEIIIESEED